MNNEEIVEALDKYTRLTNYLAAAQIFLKDNVFLEKPFRKEDLKERFLGHWGTCPGINLIYAHENLLIQKYPQYDFLLTVGPGHGFPAYQANIFLDGSFTEVYPEKVPFSKKGARDFIRHFSVPYGYPSHLNPKAPGVILEGGELGYSLSVATGAILDNPRLINFCIIGDGESETATLSASWNVNKFISRKTDGVVLPILHLNGYKISGPTIFGRMSNDAIKDFFHALGWNPYIIEAESPRIFHEKALSVFDEIIAEIERVKAEDEDIFPRWPLLVMKTPKGMTSVAEVEGVKNVGNYASHQIVFEHLRESEEEQALLVDWLKSYRIDELIHFDEDGNILLDDDIQSLIPKVKERKLGLSPYAHGVKRKEIILPSFEERYVSQDFAKTSSRSSMHEMGAYLAEIIKKGNDFRLFSPDETYSNKLQDIFSVTQRVWQLAIKDWDRDLAREGRVIELLSENVLFGMLWGYTLTGRYGYLVSYEAFTQIVASMADQYVKFIKIAKDVPFRKDYPALNIVLSSLLERQDHNGFSHQNPSFIASNLDRDRNIINVYLPADKNLMQLALEKTLQSSNALNIIVAGKKMTRTWLTLGEAKKQAEDGIMIWERYSDEDPDIVIVGAGDYVMEEIMAGLPLLRAKLPNIRFRLVNIFQLDVLHEQDARFSPEEIIEKFFGKDTGIIFNYHGYPDSIKKLLFDYGISDRIIINGYQEHGSTTSPFDMKARNGLSRFQVLKHSAHLLHNLGKLDLAAYEEILSYTQEKLAWEKAYIQEHFVDPESIQDWKVD